MRITCSSPMAIPMRRLLPLTAALLLAADGAFSANLDRLFYTPGERAALDAQRHQRPLPGTGTDTVTVNGLVARSSGKSTVWVNGAPRHEGEAGEVEILRRQAAGGRVTVRPPATDRAVDLKVGQTLEEATGRVREVYDPPQNKEAVEEDIE